jgi:hypothetical protein
VVVTLLNSPSAHEIESEEKAKEYLNCYMKLIEACCDDNHCTPETTLDALLNIVKPQETFDIDLAPVLI